MITTNKSFTIQTGQSVSDAIVNISASFSFETQNEANRFFELFNSTAFERIIRDYINMPIPQAIPQPNPQENTRVVGLNYVPLSELNRNMAIRTRSNVDFDGMEADRLLEMSRINQRINQRIRLSNLICDTIDKNESNFKKGIEITEEKIEEKIEIAEEINSIDSLNLNNE